MRRSPVKQQLKSNNRCQQLKSNNRCQQLKSNNRCQQLKSNNRCQGSPIFLMLGKVSSINCIILTSHFRDLYKCLYRSLWNILVGFYKHKIGRRLTILSYSLYKSIFYPLVLVIHLNALQKPAYKINKINCINQTVNFKLKLNIGLSVYMLSTNWTWVRWGIPPLAPCTNIKQIMTGLEGNRQIYLPREIQDHLPKSFY